MALPATYEADRLLSLVARFEPQARQAFVNAIAAAESEQDLDELAALIEMGRLNQPIDRSGTVISTAVFAVAAIAFVETGRQAIGFVADAVERAIEFDQTSPRAVGHLQRERSRMVREFTAEQRRATHRALIDGITRSANPIEQARNFRSSIGLTERQVMAVQSFRQLLERGSLEALTRNLRDRRFDGTVRRAASTGEPLTASQIAQMVDRYQQRFVRFRSEVIARTEALRAVHAGHDEGFRQAIDDGQVAQGQLMRTWVTARDDRVRDSHQALDGQVRGLDEVWQGATGSLRFPGDPAAPVSETAQCRCVLTTRLAAPAAPMLA